MKRLTNLVLNSRGFVRSDLLLLTSVKCLKKEILLTSHRQTKYKKSNFVIGNINFKKFIASDILQKQTAQENYF